MKIGPKYKIARRLGAPIFEKTQTQKFTLSEARKSKAKSRRRSKPRTDFGMQLIEKQKARFTYGVSEKQFSNYVKKATAQKAVKPADSIFQQIEKRLDNVVYRMGLASTRMLARQIVSHGHITVNGKKVTIPSYKVSLGESVKVREGSMKSKLFENLEEKMKNVKSPAWVGLNIEKKVAVIQGEPKVEKSDLLFDLDAVLEFYSR